MEDYWVLSSQADQQLLDQQSVVNDDQIRGGRHNELLISEIGIVDRHDPDLISIPKDATEFTARYRYSPWHDQRRCS